MKRFAFFAILVMFAAGAVFAVERHSSSSTFTINPSEMKDGETKSFTDDGRTVTVRRDGNTTHVTIEGAKGTRTLTITNDDGEIHIDGSDGLLRRKIVLGDGPKIWVEGGEGFKKFEGLAPFDQMLPRKATTWFVCPKDKTIMRVPEEKADQTFKCPVDGTVMEKKKNRGFTFFFDDGTFDSHDL